MRLSAPYLWKKAPAEPDAGAVYEADFGYVAADVACNPPHTHHEKILSWAYVNDSVNIPSVAEIKQAIYDHGPVSVAICAGNALSNYTGGVFATNESCGSSPVNHGVVLVGWDQGLGAWRMRNSWSPGWGEGGYAWVAYGTSNIGYGASYIEYAGTTPPPPPAAPGNLHVTSTGQTVVNLAWNDGSDNETGFKVERSPNGVSGWAQVGMVGANVTTYVDSGLALSTTYHYRVRAYNTSGDSAYSNVAQATTRGAYTEQIYLPFLVRREGITPPSGLLDEGFEGGQMPPLGWSTVDTNFWGNNWTLVNSWALPDFVHTGDYAAWVNYDTWSVSDEWLVTPPIDLSGVAGASLEFWAQSNTQFCNADMLLHVTTVGGSILETVWDMCADEAWTAFVYRPVTVDLSAYDGQTIKLAWQYVGIDGQSFGLDDVRMYASSAD